MTEPDKLDVQIISRNSNWTKAGIQKTLEENIYSRPGAWRMFLRILFLSLGLGFSVAGIFFFILYNWDGMSPRFKLSLIEAAVIIPILVILLLKINPLASKIILTGATLLVGGMFLVFGQVYQTGATAYDFFMVWVVFVSLWVFVSNFPALWLIYLMLISAMIGFYGMLIADNWGPVTILTTLFVLDASALILFLILRSKMKIDAPVWFTHTVALGAVYFGTVGCMNLIFDHFEEPGFVLLLVGAICYGSGIYYGLKNKSSYYLSIILLSLIILAASLLIKSSDGAGMLFIVGAFVITSITLLIRWLMRLNKTWINE